jgi:hypothetical protein
MNFIADIQPYLQSESIKKSFYSDRKKYESLENVSSGYSILRYDKSCIDMKDYDNVKTVGMMRSVIVSKDNEIVSFSPPKSTQLFDFVSNIDNFTPLVEEYVEGTMINMFWDKYTESWEYSTKNTIGCKSHYHHIDFDIYNQPYKQFLTMFLDAYFYNHVNQLHFDKSCCYSFVLQHPQNRIVGYVKEPLLYLIACYRIIDTQVFYMDMEPIRSQVNNLIRNQNITNILRFPLKYEFTSIDDIQQTFENHPDYSVMGVVLKNPYTGEYSKIRNKRYMSVKELAGNHTSLLYRYITLSKLGKLKPYLDCFPEHYRQFDAYYRLLNAYCYTLENFTRRLSSGRHINEYFKRTKPHHVNMVYHLKQIQTTGIEVSKYILGMTTDNLYYALKQYRRMLSDES